MVSGIRSGVYWALLCRQGILSKILGGRFKAWLPKSSGKGLSNKS